MDIHTEKHWRPYCCYTIVLKQHMASYCDGNTWESMQSLNFCRSNFTTMTTVKFLWKFQQSSMKLLIKVRSLCKKTTKSSNLALTSDLSGNSLVLEYSELLDKAVSQVGNLYCICMSTILLGYRLIADKHSSLKNGKKPSFRLQFRYTLSVAATDWKLSWQTCFHTVSVSGSNDLSSISSLSCPMAVSSKEWLSCCCASLVPFSLSTWPFLSSSPSSPSSWSCCVSSSSFFFLVSSRGPVMLIPAAPRGAVRRIASTAIVSTWGKQTVAEASRNNHLSPFSPDAVTLHLHFSPSPRREL